MPDILHADLSKRYIQMGVWLLRRKLGEGATVEAIKADMQNCGNPVFAKAYQILIEGAKQTKQKHQRKSVEEIGGLLLWILYKDTAYKDIAIYLLNEIFKNKDEMQRDLKPYLKPPEEWYVNVWYESKNQTKEGHDDGTISRFGKSFSEEVFTPKHKNKKR